MMAYLATTVTGDRVDVQLYFGFTPEDVRKRAGCFHSLEFDSIVVNGAYGAENLLNIMKVEGRDGSKII
jgi:hypothetical protein